MQSPEEDEALESQQLLLESSLDLVFETYDAARTQRMSDPVVILLDCEDAIGSAIARSWLGDDAVDEAIDNQRLAEAETETGEVPKTTVFAYAFPWADCRREVPAIFPYLSPVFDLPLPGDGFLAISITSGGASALTVPHSARQ